MYIFPSCLEYTFDYYYLLSQPFRVFGSLAAAESQCSDKVPEKQGRRAPRRPSSADTRRRNMSTNSIGSVLSFYRQLPRATYRLTKAIVLNIIADRLTTMPQDNVMKALAQQDNHRSVVIWTVCSSVACLVTAPIRLLCTESIVFKRFDWRSLQLNSKIFPIFLPNILSNIARCTGSLVYNRLAENLCKLVVRLHRGQNMGSDRLALELGILMFITPMLGILNVYLEVFRTRRDLLVLNGDSDHSILPIDETYEGALLDGLTNNKNYSVTDACSRYLYVSTIPSNLILLVAKCATYFACMWFKSLGYKR